MEFVTDCDGYNLHMLVDIQSNNNGLLQNGCLNKMDVKDFRLQVFILFAKTFRLHVTHFELYYLHFSVRKSLYTCHFTLIMILFSSMYNIEK